MNEALQLHPKSSTDFKDGDDGGERLLSSMVVSVVDNGYILSVLLVDAEEGEIDMQEVFQNNDELLARMKELLCM